MKNLNDLIFKLDEALREGNEELIEKLRKERDDGIINKILGGVNGKQDV